MVKTIYLFSFGETPRKFIIAELSYYCRGTISTDEDPSLRIESSAIINLRGVSTKLNKFIATCHLHTCFNLLKKLATSLCITGFGYQLATSLLATCHISACCNKLLQDINRPVTAWALLAVWANACT